MTREKLHEMGLIKDNTEIYVCKGSSFNILAYGHWYEDNVLNYIHHDFESFTWEKADNFSDTFLKYEKLLRITS